MTDPKNTQAPMSLMDAIYQRRAVRDYLPQPVDQDTIRDLLECAIHAPTAMHQEPWSFAIIQDRKILNRLSDSSKAILKKEVQGVDSALAKQTLEYVNNPDSHIFYNANTLIVIYGTAGFFVEADCWLAAENLLLSACTHQLGSCVIGFAVSALNTLEWKAELNVPAEMTAIAPIIVGFPAGETPPTPRKPPKILAWK